MKLLFSLVLGIGILFSCTKENQETEEFMQLIAKEWKVDQAVNDDNTDVTQNWSLGELRFSESGSYYHGHTNNPLGVDIQEIGFWSFNKGLTSIDASGKSTQYISTDSTLVLTKDFHYSWELISLSEQEMWLAYSYSNGTKDRIRFVPQ